MPKKLHCRLPKKEETRITEITHSSSKSFDFNNQCFFFFEREVHYDPKKSNKDTRKVHTKGLLETVRSHAVAKNDNLGRTVLLRLLNRVLDLMAAKGQCHCKCHPNFSRLPEKFSNKVHQPPDKKKCFFLKLCTYINENEDSQFCTKELVEVR